MRPSTLGRLLCSVRTGRFVHHNAQATAYTADRLQLKRNSLFSQLTDADVSHFERIVGSANVIQGDDVSGYNVDWLGIFRGRSQCVLRPGSENEVCAILQHCHKRNLALVPQGGHTGLVGGGTPVFDEVVVSLARIDQHVEFDPVDGHPRMVDVGTKAATNRVAKVKATIRAHPSVFKILKAQQIDAGSANSLQKGDAILIAKLAGIQAAKKTSDLIPLCHNSVPLTSVKCDIWLTDGATDKDDGQVHILSTVSTNWVTGVEMEAYICTSLAAATLYDMCKSIHKGGLIVTDLRLVFKDGGKSGRYRDGDFEVCNV